MRNTSSAVGRSPRHAAASFGDVSLSSCGIGSRRRSSASSRSAGTASSPRSARAHREEVAGRGDVVDAQHVRPAVEAVRDGRERAGQPCAGRAVGERADEVLARDGEQDRQAQLVQLVEAAQQLDRLRRVLAEVGAGADQEPLVRHARRACDLEPLGQQGASRRRPRRRSAGRTSFCFGRARVCVTTSAAPDDAHSVGHLGVDQAAGVVHDRRARLDRGLCHRGLVRVDGHDRALPPRARAISGATRSISSCGSTGGRFVTPDSPPTSSRSAPSASSSQPSFSPRIEILAGPGIRERVGRRVQDAHHERRGRQVEADGLVRRAYEWLLVPLPGSA